jgi:pimeloyl-ACP methyl ester carboxylesterase
MSIIMCCSESKTNRINVESTNDNIEVRKGRWLRITYRNPDAYLGSNHVFGSAVHSSVLRVNSWLGNGIENKTPVSSEGHSSNERTNKIVIFFIHGVGGCSDIWNEQMEYFSKLGYVVVAPDILGHGGSAAPRDESSYTFSELAYDMFAVFDRYRSEKRNILVGHSYG